jgi:hypothetical protein
MLFLVDIPLKHWGTRRRPDGHLRAHGTFYCSPWDELAEVCDDLVVVVVKSSRARTEKRLATTFGMYYELTRVSLASKQQPTCRQRADWRSAKRNHVNGLWPLRRIKPIDVVFKQLTLSAAGKLGLAGTALMKKYSRSPPRANGVSSFSSSSPALSKLAGGGVVN